MSLGNRLACQQGECHPSHTKLAQAVNCLIEHSAPSVKDVVGELAKGEIHYSKQAVYDFANAYRDDQAVRIPLCVVDAVEEIYGRPVVTEALALRRGGMFVPLPVVDCGDATVVEQQKNAIKEFAEAIQLDAVDPETRIREINDAIKALLILRESETAKASAADHAQPFLRAVSR